MLPACEIRHAVRADEGRVGLSRGDVEPVPRAEVDRTAVRRDGHRSFEDDAHLVRLVDVLRVRRVRLVRPFGHDKAFRDECGDQPHAFAIGEWHAAYDSGVPRPPLEPLLAAPQKALKEWAVVCRALEVGKQSVLLRKGGIIEETRDFSLVERRFLLYPTYEHQGEGSVQEPYRAWFRETLETKPPEDIVRISSWAEVTDLFLTHSLDALLAISDRYAWSEDYIRMRMAYKPRKPMNVVVVRTWTLPAAVDVVVLEHFAGCKSWVPLDDAIDLDGSAPVLDGASHALRVEEISRELEAHAERVAV
jgi:hypothetical protein